MWFRRTLFGTGFWRVMDALNRRVNSGDRGMNGLPDVFLHFFVYVWGCCVGDCADSES